MNTKKLGLMIAVLSMALSFMFRAVPAQADDTSQNISISKLVSNMKIGGDLRIRQENFWKDSRGAFDRSRQRFRLRYGVTSTLQDFTVGFRLASGTGEQVSTNQSFDNMARQKSIWIDQAYIQWKALTWAKLTGGKMENPFWRMTTSDMMWDGDINPEGFAEQFEYNLTEKIGVFGNFAQIVMDEDSTDNRDQWMIGYQAGVKTSLSEEVKFNCAAAVYDFLNPTSSDFGQNDTLASTPGNPAGVGQGVVQAGNTRMSSTNNTLASSFTIVNLTGELKFRAGLPVAIFGDFVQNVQSEVKAANDKMGWGIGARINNAKTAGSWELGWYYKWLEMDATLADFADSDFGDGGTNRKGNTIWVSWCPRDYATLTAKVFSNKTLNRDLMAYGTGATRVTGNDQTRMQIDLVVKF
jgi:hypothetical protein